MIRRLIWRWQRHMAAHREYAARVDVDRWPSPANQRRLETRMKKVDEIDCNRPW
jgi:hypothetical protein